MHAPPGDTLDLKDIKGIGPATEEKLNDAGITSVDDLAAADIEDLADEAGVSSSRLQRFQERALDLTDAPAEDHHEAEDHDPQADETSGEDTWEDDDLSLPESIEDLKVVLQDRAQSARVRVGDAWHDNVPIVTAKINESAERKMQQVKENVVLLKEKAQTAYVRIEDTWHENVPIFRERQKAGGVTEETRVQVEEVREKPKDEEGFLDRVKNLFRR